MHADLRLRPMALQLEKLGSWDFSGMLEEFFFGMLKISWLSSIFILLFGIFNH